MSFDTSLDPSIDRWAPSENRSAPLSAALHIPPLQIASAGSIKYRLGFVSANVFNAKLVL